MKNVLLIILIAGLFSSCNDPQENTDEAIPKTTSEQELKALLTKYPDSLSLAEDLATLYEAKDNYPAAISVLKKQLQLDSTNGRIYQAIGFLYYENDDTTNAIAYYSTARKLSADPKNLIALGTLQAGLGNMDALLLADQLLQPDSTGAAKEAYYIQGVYYSRVGKNEQAIYNFDKCLAASYTFTNAYLEKAAVQVKQNNYPAAIATLDRGITVQNNFPDAYYAKGLYLQQTGEKDKARAAYDQAIMYDPEFTDAILARKSLDNK